MWWQNGQFVSLYPLKQAFQLSHKSCHTAPLIARGVVPTKGVDDTRKKAPLEHLGSSPRHSLGPRAKWIRHPYNPPAGMTAATWSGRPGGELPEIDNRSCGAVDILCCVETTHDDDDDDGFHGGIPPC